MRIDCSECIWHDSCESGNVLPENCVCDYFDPGESEDRYYFNILKENTDEYNGIITEQDE